MSTISTDLIDFDSVDERIKRRESFSIQCGKEMSISDTADKIMYKIEKQNLRCRVYTANRSAALAVGLIPTGITQIASLATAIGIAAHNIATYDPDYEVVKDIVDNKIDVICKKELPLAKI